MTELEMDAWDAMIDALNRCEVALGPWNALRAEVEHALDLAVKAREPADA